MTITGGIASRLEQHNNIIGQIDCTSDNVSEIIVGMMQSMGMSNPAGNVTSSSKGVTVTKKGNKFTLVLSMFTPPIKITWTGPVPYSQILGIIETASSKKQKLGWINVINLSDGSKYFQFGIA